MTLPALRAILVAPLLFSTALANAAADLQVLSTYGPRVAGSPAGEQARAYVAGQLRALGYTVRSETFSYPRFDDLGSDVKLGESKLDGLALQGTQGGEVSAPIARVPGLGSSQDFAGVNVRGRIAVVARGQLPFAEKARGALAAGALGLIVVNNAPGDVRGTLGEGVALPVLGVSQDVGAQLTDGEAATLNVRVRSADVRGVNVVAQLARAAPQLLFGAHLDSVTRSPGANDNASGSVAVLELARRIRNTPLAGKSVFVLFDGEEDGLRGSRAYVSDEKTGGLKAMFNFDMVGVNVTPLAVGGDRQLGELAQKTVPSLKIFQDGGNSDHASFLNAGVPALFFHRGVDPNYHQPGDQLADPTLIEGTVDAALKVAGALLDTK